MSEVEVEVQGGREEEKLDKKGFREHQGAISET